MHAFGAIDCDVQRLGAFTLGAFGDEIAQVSLVEPVDALGGVKIAELEQDPCRFRGLRQMLHQRPLHQTGTASVRGIAIVILAEINGARLDQAVEQFANPLPAVAPDGGVRIGQLGLADREDQQVADRSRCHGLLGGRTVQVDQMRDRGAGDGAGMCGLHLFEQKARRAEKFLVEAPDRKVGSRHRGAIGRHIAFVTAVLECHTVGACLHERGEARDPIGAAEIGVDDPGGFGPRFDGKGAEPVRRHQTA